MVASSPDSADITSQTSSPDSADIPSQSAPQEERTSGGSGFVVALVVVLFLLPTICGLLFVTYKYLFIIDRYVSGLFQKPTKDENLDEEKGLEKGSERTIDTNASLVFANTSSKKQNGSPVLPFDDINSRDLPFCAISDPVLQGGVEKGSRTSRSDSSQSSVVSASMGQQVDERLSGEQSENESEPEGVAEQPSISLHVHLKEEEHVSSTQGAFAGSRRYLELLAQDQKQAGETNGRKSSISSRPSSRSSSSSSSTSSSSSNSEARASERPATP